MRSKTQRPILALLIAVLVLAFWGQYYFAYKRQYMWDGIALYGVAMLLFTLLVARVEPRPAAERRVPVGWWGEVWRLLQASYLRLMLLGLGLLSGIYAAMAALKRSGTLPFWDLLVLWVVSIVLVVSAFVDWRGLGGRLRRWGQRTVRPTPEGLAVATLALATLLLRVVCLGSIPFVLSGDEASMGLEAIAVLEGRRNSPFITGWLSHPTLYFFIQAAFLRVFGVTTWALRLPSAIASAGTVVLFYLLVRRMFSTGPDVGPATDAGSRANAGSPSNARWLALMASVFFAAYHYAIHYGRLAINNIWDAFFAVGILYFFDRGLARRRLGDLLVAGVLLGLAAYFYMGARLIPIILVIYFAYWAWRDRGILRGNAAHLAVMVLVAAVVALPLLFFFQQHPKDMTARWGMMGIFPSGWVAQEMQRTGRSMFSIVFYQFLKAALAFNYFRDPTYWYRPGIPLLHFVPSIFFIFGLTYAVVHWRERRYFLLVLWYLLVVIFGGALLENPPTSPRLVLCIPAIVILTTLGIERIATYIAHSLEWPRSLAVALALVLVLGASVQSAHFYFAKYTPSHEFGGQNTEVADRLGKYLRVLGPDYQCYFFGAPRMYYGFASIPFLARNVVGMDVEQPITDAVTFVNPARDAVFVFLPERVNELQVVRRTYPAGLMREFKNIRGQVLFISYEVDI